MTVRWLSVAEIDLTQALDYYLEESPDAAEHLTIELDRALEAITQRPLTFPIFEGTWRTKLIKNFPISILYSAEGDEIVVKSLRHHKRKPGFWSNRV